MIVEVRETRRLTRHGVSPLFLTDDDRCTPQEVAGRDNALLRQDQHGARAFNLLIHQIDALHERTAHVDEQRHEFGLVDRVGGILAEVHPTIQQFLGNLFEIIDLRHRHHGIATQVRVHEDRLRVGVTDHTYPLIAVKRIQLILELRTKIVTLQTMDLTTEAFLMVKSYQSCTSRTQVRIIVRTVEQVVDTAFRTDGSKESSHTCYPSILCLCYVIFNVQSNTGTTRCLQGQAYAVPLSQF